MNRPAFGRRFPVSAAVILAFILFSMGLTGCATNHVIPDLRGVSLPEAEERLMDLSLKGAAQDASGGDRIIWIRGNWTVVGQEPEGGLSVPTDSEITLQVLKNDEVEGGRPKLVVVPELRGTKVTPAAQAAKSLGLTTNVVDNATNQPLIDPDGYIVVGQNPVVGQHVPIRSVIQLRAEVQNRDPVPAYFREPCEKLMPPLTGLANLGLDVSSPAASSVIASDDREQAEALKLVGATALASCSTQGLGVHVFQFSTVERAQEHMATALRSAPDPKSRTTNVQQIPGAQMMVDPGYGTAAIYWTAHAVSVAVVTNYDDTKVQGPPVQTHLIEAATNVDKQLR